MNFNIKKKSCQPSGTLYKKYFSLSKLLKKDIFLVSKKQPSCSYKNKYYTATISSKNYPKPRKSLVSAQFIRHSAPVASSPVLIIPPPVPGAAPPVLIMVPPVPVKSQPVPAMSPSVPVVIQPVLITSLSVPVKSPSVLMMSKSVPVKSPPVQMTPLSVPVVSLSVLVPLPSAVFIKKVPY